MSFGLEGFKGNISFPTSLGWAQWAFREFLEELLG